MKNSDRNHINKRIAHLKARWNGRGYELDRKWSLFTNPMKWFPRLYTIKQIVEEIVASFIKQYKRYCKPEEVIIHSLHWDNLTADEIKALQATLEERYTYHYLNIRGRVFLDFEWDSGDNRWVLSKPTYIENLYSLCVMIVQAELEYPLEYTWKYITKIHRKLVARYLAYELYKRCSWKTQPYERALITVENRNFFLDMSRLSKD
ncbi:MAG: hypothetical protein KAU01_04095 [Candidatus Cloacimonetes bacterium]|nr:hypothetical protein [Candidatus Cloacimonadota bacterium]